MRKIEKCEKCGKENTFVQSEEGNLCEVCEEEAKNFEDQANKE